MKNIFLLPTADESNLYTDLDFKVSLRDSFQNNNRFEINQFIYITNDEKIENKNYVLSDLSIGALYLDGVINTVSMLAEGKWKKVILTTDQDLIADGIQEMDDTFLEWFVKNPNCEKVEIMKLEKLYAGIDKYEIIIPEEEPSWKELENIIAEKMLEKADITVTLHKRNVLTTEELKYPIGGYAPGNYMCNCTTCKTRFQGDKRAVQCEPCAVKMVEEQSQLLIENDRISAEKEQNRVEWIAMMHKQNLNGRETEDELFEAGVRAGIEESYSEEEVLEILYKVGGWTMPDVEEWFEKHKKI